MPSHPRIQPLSEEDGAETPKAVEVEDGVVVRRRGGRRRKVVDIVRSCLGWMMEKMWPVNVYCRIDGDDHKWIATARIDTQCDVNLISASWLRARNIEPGRLDRITDGPERINRIDGSTDLVGRVQLGWYGVDTPYKNQRVFLKPRIIVGDFLVEAPGDGFDIIIGQDTIQAEKLLEKERFCYTRTNQGGNIPRKVPLTAQERQAAEEARRREKALQDQAKLQKAKQRSARP